jgi:hypothetical protein
VFDAIGFVYPDYRYPIRGQKRKGTTSAKEETAAAPSESTPERKRIKVLTHRPRFIEPASVPEFTGETSSATEAEKPTEPTLLPEVAEMAEAPTRIELKEPKVLLPETKEMAEAPLTEKMEKVKGFTEGSEISEVLSPSANVESIKNQKGRVVTPKRKRMVTVLDVLETIESSNTTPKKTAETSETETKVFDAEAPRQQAETEAGPSGPTKEEKISEPIPVEEISAVAPEASPTVPDYFVRHASGKKLSKKEKQEARFYAQKLKYPKGALIFNGSGEEDFLYCLPDSKEISVCREMSKSFGFPTLEDGLSVLSKDELADSLAYNSLKVQNLRPSYFLLRSKIFRLLKSIYAHTFFSAGPYT